MKLISCRPLVLAATLHTSMTSNTPTNYSLAKYVFTYGDFVTPVIILCHCFASI